MGNPLLKARACSDACGLNASTLGCHISSDLFKSALCCFLGTLSSLLNIESVRDFTMKAVKFWIVWSTGQLLVPSSLFWVKKTFFSGNFVLNIIGHTFLSLIIFFYWWNDILVFWGDTESEDILWIKYCISFRYSWTTLSGICVVSCYTVSSQNAILVTG